MVDLITVLEKTVSPDNNELRTALRFLEEASERNLPELLMQLSDVLKEPSNSAIARSQAGLQLKNFLKSSDPKLRQQYMQRWLSIDEAVRLAIKRNVVQALGTEQLRPSSAAQCVALITCAELPHGLWPEVISHLTGNVTAGEAITAGVREVSLEAIGYICQDMDPNMLQSQAHLILPAVICGMRKEEPNTRIRLAAISAFLNVLPLTKHSFEIVTERNHIMQAVCDCTQANEQRIRVIALECLGKILTNHYKHMEVYMREALFPITVHAIKEGPDEIALQGIEFWSTVCDEESQLAYEMNEAAEAGKPPERISKFYAKGAMQYIVPMLLERLTQQDEHDDEDEWTPCKAASVCLMLMAGCCEGAILPHVLPFVERHILDENWHLREACVMAFGCVLEGPDADSLRAYIEKALPVLVLHLKDTCIQVRDTAAWTVGRICEILPAVCFQDPEELKKLIDALLISLDAEPRVAANVCWTLSSLANGAYETAVSDVNAIGSADGASAGASAGDEPAMNALSSYFVLIVEKLLATSVRADGAQSNLRNSAYEALMEMLRHAPRDCYPVVQQTTMTVLQRLEHMMQLEAAATASGNSPVDRQQFYEILSQLCATLAIVLRRLTPTDAPQVSDIAMQCLLRVCQSPTAMSGVGVHEDALLAISSLVQALGPTFAKYLPLLQPVIVGALEKRTEHEVCSAAVGVVDDLCRAVGSQMAACSQLVMPVMLAALQDVTLDRRLRPQILSCFGSIALAIGPAFSQYLGVVLSVLQMASQAEIDRVDYDLVEYLNELREAVLDAYTGIIQGLRGPLGPDGQPGQIALSADDAMKLLDHASKWVAFLDVIQQDADTSESVLGAACGLVGDLATLFGATALPLLDTPAVHNLLQQTRKRVGKPKQLATWAFREIRKLKNQRQQLEQHTQSQPQMPQMQQLQQPGTFASNFAAPVVSINATVSS